MRGIMSTIKLFKEANMKTKFCKNIILSRVVITEDTTYRYRVIRTPRSECSHDFSLLVSTESDDDCDECFVFSISTDEEKAVRLCEYFAGETVSAMHTEEILSDLIGEMTAPSELRSL
jgi:hypothetical protein